MASQGIRGEFVFIPPRHYAVLKGVRKWNWEDAGKGFAQAC